MGQSVVQRVAHGRADLLALVERSLDGDHEAYGALVEPRLEALYRTALAILRHEADA